MILSKGFPVHPKVESCLYNQHTHLDASALFKITFEMPNSFVNIYVDSMKHLHK